MSRPRPLPDSDDLIGRLHFDTKEGRIWLDDQRMVLMHTRRWACCARS
jgi:hypothetical protein